MVMYDNELKTKETKNSTKDKIEPQHWRAFATPAIREWYFSKGLHSLARTSPFDIVWGEAP